MVLHLAEKLVIDACLYRPEIPATQIQSTSRSITSFTNNSHNNPPA